MALSYYKGWALMHKQVLVLMLLLTSFNLHASDGLGKYRSLVKCVDKAEGRMVLYMNPGYYKTTVNRRQVRINSDESSAGARKIEVKFKVNNGKLLSLEMVFNPTIHVALLGNQCISLGINKLSFDEDGDLIADQSDFKWDTPTCTSPNTKLLLDALKPDLAYSDMLNGSVFSIQSSFVACKADGTSLPGKTLFIYRVFFNDPSSQGLLVTFKENSTWVISEIATEGRSNLLSFHASSHAKFQSIDYNMNENTLLVNVKDFILDLKEAKISTGKMNLVADSNTSFEIGEMSLIQRDNNFSLTYDEGNFSSNISAGSSITLINNIPSALNFNTGSHVSLSGLTLKIDNRSLTYHFEASDFVINILSGNIPIGEKGNVSLGPSSIKLALAGTYSRNDIILNGSISELDLNIESGNIYFSESKAPIVLLASKIASRKPLNVSSSIPPYITGQFSIVTFACDDYSEFAVNNSLFFSLGKNTTISFDDPNYPFELHPNEKYPLGKFKGVFKFKEFRNYERGNFILGKGEASGLFHLKEKEVCLVDNFRLDATLTLGFSLSNSPINLLANCTIRDGSLKQKDQKPYFEGVISFAIKKTDFKPFTIEGARENGQYVEKDRFTFYSTDVLVKLQEDLILPDTKVSFYANTINIKETAFPLKIALAIPGGCGQKDEHTGVCNGKGISGKQEVVRLDCTDPAGVAHFYAEPVSVEDPYYANATVSLFSNDASKVSLNLSELSLSKNILYDTDGCKDFLAGVVSLAVSVVGELVCGPCGVPLGIIAFFKAKDYVNAFIQQRLLSYITDFNQTIVLNP